MGSRIESGEIEAFLAAHKPVSTAGSVAPGVVLDDWRVTAFLGRGGSGEVYRVVHTTLGTAAALKVCVKNPERDAARDEAVCARFRREARLLAENKHPAFPCFLGFGEREGRPWYVMELLEYRPLPTTEREIARFLLAVASGVRHLHSQGIIHRDIKPGNILWRMVGSRVPRDRGKMVGSRVPRDRGPQEILQLPHTTMAPTTGTPNENPSWQALCRNFTTNIVTHQTEMRRPDAVKRLSPAEFVLRANEPQYRPVLVSKTETNKIDATMVNLGGRTIVFNEPIPLDAGREYWIVGPGILDAQFSAASTATVRIANCIFRNRTKISPVNAGIDYVLDGGAYLNFTDLPSTETLKLEVSTRVRSNGMSEGRRWWRIKGPNDLAELADDKLW